MFTNLPSLVYLFVSRWPLVLGSTILYGAPSFFLFLILCFLLKFGWIPSWLFWILNCYSASFAVESVSRGISLVYLYPCNVSLLWEFDWAFDFVGFIWLIISVCYMPVFCNSILLSRGKDSTVSWSAFELYIMLVTVLSLSDFLWWPYWQC